MSTPDRSTWPAWLQDEYAFLSEPHLPECPARGVKCGCGVGSLDALCRRLAEAEVLLWRWTNYGTERASLVSATDAYLGKLPFEEAR